MRVLRLLALSIFLPFALSNPQTATIYYQPLSSSSPTPLAQIRYSPSSPSTEQNTLLTFTPPSVHPSTSPSDLIRIGILPPPDNPTLVLPSTVISLSTFSPALHGLFRIRSDPLGALWSVSYHASAHPYPAQWPPSADIRANISGFDVIPTSPAPTPVLNQPVRLTPEGKLPEKEEEKSFFQK
ncbi:hypothetical protein MMC20_004878 [Loxospora ochrophaea]|nr:hypothetical protein [Loxospora ochrophaea]